MISGAMNAVTPIVGFMMFSAVRRSSDFDRRLVLAGYTRSALLVAELVALGLLWLAGASVVGLVVFQRRTPRPHRQGGRPDAGPAHRTHRDGGGGPDARGGVCVCGGPASGPDPGVRRVGHAGRREWRVAPSLPERQFSVRSAISGARVVGQPTGGVAMSARRKRDTGPPAAGPGEKDVLTGFLGYLRAAVVAKVEGVPEARARIPGVPSGTNLLGLVRHLTHVERHWLLGHAVTDWKATFHLAQSDTAESVVAAYRQTVAEANEEIASWDDLTEAGPRPPGRGRQAPSRRWTLTHLIEETARHAGHADILRELIDGATGR